MTTAVSRSLFVKRPAAEMLTRDDVWKTFVDPAGIAGFWVKEYLRGLVAAGAGKVKLVRGRPGAGKTHLLRYFGLRAQDDGYVVCRVDARTARLAAVDDLYRAVGQALDWDDLLDRCASGVIRDGLGFPEFSGSPHDFRAWAEAAGRSPVSLMADIRAASDHFVRGLDISKSLREPIRSSIVRRMGTDLVEENTLLRWLRGERLNRQERNGINAAASVDRRNAREMLRSLAVLARAAGRSGLLVLIDNAEVLAGTARRDGVQYYTRNSRDQAYEMIRELIDESHLSPHLFIMIFAEADLFDGQKTGLASYPALWHRVQPEIVTSQVNRFADVIDLDTLWRSEDLGRLRTVWSESFAQVALIEETSDESAAAPELDWSNTRRAVRSALAAANGGM